MSKKEKSRHDDFQKIKGIGEVIARILQEQGITTYQELADLTSDRLVELLRGKISDLSLRRIEVMDWPAQARALLQKAIQDVSEVQSHTVRREAWRELADFFISFGFAMDEQGKEFLRTKVHHSQADKLQEWDGIATEQLVTWILEQADLSKKAARASASPKMDALQSTALLGNDGSPISEINGEKVALMAFSDVMVNETESHADSMREQPVHVLHIETELTLDKDSLEQTYERPPYSVEIYLIDMHTNQSKLANAYSGYLSPGHLSYQISQDIDIPEAGRYQLLLFARLLPPFAGIAQAQGPMIRVEA